ncbi:4-aminobutyrate--2-oxoglutarate transaminase [Actinopolyspora saharensis]|uniref:(S)-3-amino-2-methylpropionate transaminase n=1 Tax=Actinopolyspora saharensis TaxID=995062 RepID=A0A1H1A5F5_9ACTN|nr:4-aminobutyrate--2-oxoglutarate transaminase [Actinopolyspora saharensis]SDQ34741.1 4-aminobutyrate aminotransferase / (S)-3-amino-2-methylpropionate transaminase [Actinopolyspora saharensis]
MTTLTNEETPAARKRLLRTEIPGPKSRELQGRRAMTVATGVGSALPVYVTGAEEGVLHDVDGNVLIDLGSGIAVTNVGNAAPEVVDAIRGQAGEFTHTCFMVTPYENYLEVCEELAEVTPGEHDKRTVLFNSGAEAVENAVKIARRATGRQAVVVFDHAYHGRTNLTMAMTAKSVPYKHGFGPFTSEVYRMPMSYPARDGADGAETARGVIDRIEKQVGADSVAAVVVEPVQGEGGFVEPAEGFLPELSRWCAESGALFVADEIQTGFCRTGDWFACEHEGVVPDLITTAKGIAGGMPLAGVTGRAEVMDSLPPGSLGGTYGGNPVSCAAALGAIRAMRERDLAGAARDIQHRALPRLRALAERTERILEVRGRGAMLGVEFVRAGSGDPDPELAARVAKTCHERGVVVLTCGTYGNVIRLLPPLVISAELLDEGLDVLEEALVEQLDHPAR